MRRSTSDIAQRFRRQNERYFLIEMAGLTTSKRRTSSGRTLVGEDIVVGNPGHHDEVSRDTVCHRVPAAARPVTSMLLSSRSSENSHENVCPPSYVSETKKIAIELA